MSKRATFWVAWSTWGLYLVMASGSLLFQIPNAPWQWLSALLKILVLLVFATVGALIASRRPQNKFGWLFCASTLLWGLSVILQAYTASALRTVPGSLPAAALMGDGGVVAGGLSWFLLLTFGLLLFPNGSLPSPGFRPLAWLIVALLFAWTIASLLAPDNPNQSDPRLAAVRNPIGIVGAQGLLDLLTALLPLLLLATVLVCIIAVVLRFRRARGDERQQLKWFAYGNTLSIFMLIALVILIFANTSVPDTFFYLAVVCIPISTGIAMLKYRLYEIDVLINRTLVYSVLTFLVVGIYVLIVGGLGTVLQVQGNLALSLIATGLVAVLFQPLRLWLQRTINRLLYGQRDEPYAVISRLGSRLEATLAPDAVLPMIVETVAQALKLPYVAIRLRDESALSAVADYGKPAGTPLSLPLLYQGETIGQLVLAPRSPRETLSAADTRLLSELARQIGLAAHAVRLTNDLQRSNEHLAAARRRLVTAREEERRRLRRDLHDGLGPTLAALTLKIGAARKLLVRDLSAVDTLLLELNGDIETTTNDIRRLVSNLRPPSLDELGLLGAIRERVAQSTFTRNAEQMGGLRFLVEAPDTLPPLTAAVEVAAYRIVQEALANVVRHARARTCSIHLTLGEMLSLEIRDDGVGLASEHCVGVGIRSMHERAIELGGTCVVEAAPMEGTRVLACLPITKE